MPRRACTAGSTRSGRTATSGRRDRIALNANSSSCSRTRPGPGRAGGRPHRRGAQLQEAAGRGADGAGRPARATAVDGAEQVPVLHHTHPRARAGHRPRAVHRAVAGPSTARHIVVFFRGGMFRLDVVGPDGIPHSLDDIEAGLRRRHEGRVPGRRTDLGRVISPPWPGRSGPPARESLLAGHPGNAGALDDVETALFCVAWRTSPPRTSRTPATSCCTATAATAGSTRRSPSSSSPTDGPASTSSTASWTGPPSSASPTPARHPGRGALPPVRGPLPGLPALEPVVFELDDALRARRAPPPTRSPRTGRTPRPAPLSFEDFGGRARPRRWGSRRTRSSRPPTSSPTSAPRGTWAPRTSRSPPGSTGTGGPRRCASSPRDGRLSWRRWRTRQRTRTPGAPRSGQPRRPMWRARRQCQAGQAPEQHLWELELIQRRRGTELGVTEQPALYRTPGWLDHAGRLPEHQLRAVRQHPVLRLRVDQQPVHRCRLCAASRPVQPLPEHAVGGRRRRCGRSPTGSGRRWTNSGSCWRPSDLRTEQTPPPDRNSRSRTTVRRPSPTSATRVCCELDRQKYLCGHRR